MREAACLTGLTCGGWRQKKVKEKSISPVKVYFILMTVYNCFLLFFKNFFLREDVVQSSAGEAYLGQGLFHLSEPWQLLTLAVDVTVWFWPRVLPGLCHLSRQIRVGQLYYQTTSLYPYGCRYLLTALHTVLEPDLNLHFKAWNILYGPRPASNKHQTQQSVIMRPSQGAHKQ